MFDPLRRVAVVTGASSGIGGAVAIELLRRHWRVAGASRRPASIQDPEYTHVRVDLADVDALTDRMEAAVGPLVTDRSVGRLGLVNSAADPGLLGPPDRADPVEILRVYAVNVVAAACASPAFIIDEFPPNACTTWANDFAANAKASGIASPVVKILKVNSTTVTGDRAYVVTTSRYDWKEAGKPMKESASKWTFALQKTAAGWRIAGWA